MKDWIKKHPQRLLAFVQITLSQVALWDFLPPKVCAILSGIAGLAQVWSAFFIAAPANEKTKEE